MSCQGGTVKMMGGGRGKKSRASRKMRGGMYGFGVDQEIGTAGAKWGGVENLPVDKSGNPIPEAVMTGVTGGRRRRTGKKGRKTRKSRRVHRRRRTMRGGANFYSPSSVGTGFIGTGIGDQGTYAGYAVNRPGGGPQIGADGVSKTT